VGTNAAVAGAGAALPGLGQTFLSLLVVLALIFALAALLKRVQRVKSGGTANLRVHGGLQVGPKERVLMIEAGGKHLLIGVAAGSVSTLHVFDQAPQPGETVTDSAPPLAGAFAEALKRALGRETKPEPKPEAKP
jgi:flagellar protein FliO/FliZ